MVSKLKWRMSEVISYVEDKILNNEETICVLEWYENYKLFGKPEKNHVLKSLIDQMNKEYKGGDI